MNKLLTASASARRKALVEPPDTIFLLIEEFQIGVPWVPRGSKQVYCTIQSQSTGLLYTTEDFNLTAAPAAQTTGPC